MAVYLLALGAALLFGLGSVVQQRAASEAPPELALSFRLLWWLARRKLWLIGVGTALVGNLLSGSALGMGSVALVQPLLVTRLLFALPLAATWMRQRVPGRDWAGALLTGAGLAAFIAIGHPSQSDVTSANDWPWAIAAGTIGVVTLVLVSVGRGLRPGAQAPLLGASAGMLFGLQSGLTHTAVHVFSHDGLIGMLSTWSAYGTACAAILGTLLAQSAYEMAPLTASYPVSAAIEPLAGIGVGIGVIGGTIRLGALPLAGEIVGLVVMSLGIYLLATSPLVTGQLNLLERRQEQGLVRRTAEELEHDLRILRADLDELEHSIAAPGRHRTHPERLRRDLHRVDRELARLDELGSDIRWESDQGRRRVAHRSGEEKTEFARYEAQLDMWQDEVDKRSTQLRRQAAVLQREADEILGGTVDQRH